MGWFHRKHQSSSQIPPGCENLQIRTRSSICTGETEIGFYDPVSRQLRYSQLVRTAEEISDFYRRYGRCTENDKDDARSK